MEEDIRNLNQEIEPFKTNGKIDCETEFKWLESKGILKRCDGIYNKTFALVYPKGMTEANVSRRYHKYQNIFDRYLLGNLKIKIGNMGIKQENKNEEKKDIDEIPF